MTTILRSIWAGIPEPIDFFPPTPAAYSFLYNVFKYFGLAGILTTFFPKLQAMGRTSVKSSIFNLPGRYAWAVAESVGPIYLTFILYTLPARLHPRPASPSSILGTGLPLANELLGFLYVAHYLNRAIISPLFSAPSMSPIHLVVVLAMCTFNFFNAGSIASWLVYSSLSHTKSTLSFSSLTTTSTASLSLPLQLLGLLTFLYGLSTNIQCERHLFALRRAAASRRAKSEGKAFITYDKVYVIPPIHDSAFSSSPPASQTKKKTTADASPGPRWFNYMLYPHYVAEWLEWLGFFLLGLGSQLPSSLLLPSAAQTSSGTPSSFFSLSSSFFSAPAAARPPTPSASTSSSNGLTSLLLTPAFWFLLTEVVLMVPRAVSGRRWYAEKFGKRAVAGRGGFTPFAAL